MSEQLRPCPLAFVGGLIFVSTALVALSEDAAAEIDRSPVDVAISSDQRWMVTANQTSNSATLIAWPGGTIEDELSVGSHPSYIAHWKDHRFLISCTESSEIFEVAVVEGELRRVRTLKTPGQPVGLAVGRRSSMLYVAMEAEASVAELDLDSGKVQRVIPTARWPRFLALSPDEKRLGVSTSGDRGVDVVDLSSGESVYRQSFIGLNIGHLQYASDGYVYFPWMVYRRNPITAGNIRLGWVLASRIGRFRLDRDERREAISLDPPGKAIADPYGIALTEDARSMVVSASGTHELLIYDVPSLPFDAITGPDHLAEELRNDKQKFDRIELGGRPMGLRMLKDQNTVLVANYLDNSVQAVDIDGRRIAKTIALGGPEPSLARQGEAIFYDARRSLDQWYSCHSCHQDGGSNAVAIDTFNDGTARTFKTVLPLYDVTQTAPWTWHGWQTDLRAAMKKSITSTMLGSEPNDHEVDALIAYLKTIKPPTPSGPLSAAAKRGAKIFATVGCADCHQGSRLSDGEVHDVGLGSRSDRYSGFNTPTLLGVGRKVKLLHDGRASSLRAVLEGDHSPAKVTGRKLNEEELEDLLAYLKRL